MASAQQKPKATGRTRNPDRRNGKAFGKNRQADPKPTGKSIAGYKKERVEAWAAKAGITVEQWKENHRKKRREQRAAAREKRRKAGKPVLVA